MFFSKYSLLDFFIATCVCLFCFSILNVIFNLLSVLNAFKFSYFKDWKFTVLSLKIKKLKSDI